VRVAAEVRLDSSLSGEVLDVLQVNATTEHDGEAAMPLLIPLRYHRERNTVQHAATRRKETPLEMQDLQACASPCNG
jgi:hypothetical protein